MTQSPWEIKIVNDNHVAKPKEKAKSNKESSDEKTSNNPSSEPRG